MWSADKISKIYSELPQLGHIELPDRLWEGGISSFKLCIDKIRTNQERTSTWMIGVSREILAAKKTLKYLRKLSMIKKGVIEQHDEIDDYLMDMSNLHAAIKLVHSDLNRCRTDLKAKIQLLESELRMGGAGSIDRAERNERSDSPGVNKSDVDTDGKIEWVDDE